MRHRAEALSPPTEPGGPATSAEAATLPARGLPATARHAVAAGELARPVTPGTRRIAPGVEVAHDRVIFRPAGRDAAAPARVVPLSAYRGVAVVIVRGSAAAPVFRLELSHGEPALSVPLASGRSVEAISRLWRGWGRTLRLPLLVVGVDGTVHAALTPLGALFAETPSARRRGSPLVGRRPRFGRRRTPGRPGPLEVVRGEREIIARD